MSETDGSDVVETITRLEAARWAAFAAADVDALASLISPRLVYRHATGGVDDHQSYLARVQDRRVSFERVEHVVRSVEPHAGAVLAHGEMRALIVDGSASRRLEVDYLAVWARDDASAWRTVAVHSAPIIA